MINHKLNSQILKELNFKVHGHENAKKAIINLISKQYMRHYQKFILDYYDDELIELSNLLLIGKSGTGKTLIIKELSNILGFPLICLDATKLNPSGSDDKNIKVENIPTMILKQAEELCRDYPSQYPSVEGTVWKTIIFIDEADKLVDPGQSYSGWMKRVQTNLLTLIEDLPCSFIFAGAFMNLFKDKKEHITKGSLGFFNSSEKKFDDPQIISECDIIKYGMMPELVGRFSQIVQLDEFGPKDFEHIFHNNIWPQKKKELKAFKLNSDLPDESVIKNIIDSAHKSDQGVRHLKRSLNRHFEDLFFDYEEKQLLTYVENDDDALSL